MSLSLGVGLGGAVVVGPAILLGAAAGPVFSITAPYLVALSQFAPAALKTARFGWSGWRSPLRCLRCGELFRSLSYYQMARLQVVPGKRAGELGVRVPCPRCRKKGVQLNAAEAELFVRRYLAHHNLFGAWSRRIEAAAAQIESLHTTGALISRLTHDRTIISTVDSTTVLALEMAMNDESERALLALKATDLEARWREAEVIAAIADGELTPVTV